MFPENVNEDSATKDYKTIEMEFHRLIMNACRRYINDLNLVTILGTLDMAKHETIELMRATKKDISSGNSQDASFVDKNNIEKEF
jgi:hypothetical protein